jgi:hypothetical protein
MAEQIECTNANVASSTSSVALQAANPLRKGWSVHNDSTSVLYVKLGATAAATSYTVKLAAGDYYELPVMVGGKAGSGVYTGVIHGIWVSENGAARVAEYV